MSIRSKVVDNWGSSKVPLYLPTLSLLPAPPPPSISFRCATSSYVGGKVVVVIYDAIKHDRKITRNNANSSRKQIWRVDFFIFLKLFCF